MIVIAGIFFYLSANQEKPYKPSTGDTTQVPENDIPEYIEGITAVTQATESVTEANKPIYVSKYDFEALKSENPDIIGWFELDGLELSEPLMYRKGDNGYYLNRNSKGELSKSGSLFIEDYNSPDFSDRMTIIYGHNMRSGAMFGDLQQNYKNEKFFKANNTFKIYTPDADYTYQIIAAFPYGTRHILYYNDFSDFEIAKKFVENCFSIRNLIAIFEKDVIIEEDDKLVILSTCLDGKENGRYLVMAKLIQNEVQE